MPLWPVVPALLVIVLAWVLYQQSVESLVITGAIVAGAVVYWALYLRPRQATHWVVTVPEDEQAPGLPAARGDGVQSRSSV